MNRSIGPWGLAWRSWRFFWRSNLATLCGVAIGVAVLTGALVVGDSVRSSLRSLALERLGDFQYALVTQSFLQANKGSEAAQASGFPADAVAEVFTFPQATVEMPAASDHAEGTRASGVTLYGIDAHFGLAEAASLTEQEVVLNRPLAEDLHAQVGDRVVLRLATPSSIPADSPLARKRDRLRSLAQMKVVAIVPVDRLGGFTLFPTHQAPRLAFVSRSALQAALGQENRVNTVLVRIPRHAAVEEARQSLDRHLQLSLADYGLSLVHHRRTPSGESLPEEVAGPITDDAQVASDFWQLTSDRMILDPVVADAAREAFAAYQPEGSLTYLANSIARVQPEPGSTELPSSTQGGIQRTAIPYSMVAAVETTAQQNPLRRPDGSAWGPLGDDEVVLNRWTAQQLGVDVGTHIELRYFAPETTHGIPIEAVARLRVSGIVELTEPARPFDKRHDAIFRDPPTAANDPWLTPVVPGVTDQDSIDDWDPPFPFDHSRIKPIDDDYWKKHRTTPKAFVSLATGQRLWGSRFGRLTAYRFAGAKTVDRASIEKPLLTKLNEIHATLGLTFRDVRSDSVRAAQGTTPFDVLFLMFSLFIIVAALILMVLLFRLAAEQRAAQMGLWKACGATTRGLRGWLSREASFTVIWGTVLGVSLGLGYAAAIVWALRTWWVAAVSTPFVHLRLHPVPLLVGGLSGGLMAWMTLVNAARGMAKIPPITLLRGDFQAARRGQQAQRFPWPLLILGLAAGGLGWIGAGQRNEAQAAAFLGSGALVLAGLLWGLHCWLRHRHRTSGTAFGLGQLAFAATRNDPTRTTLTVALTAWAAFLVVAVSLFRISPTQRGTGGFSLWGTSDQPVFANLNQAEAQQELDPALATAMRGTQIFSFRVHDGEDASCRNLYRTMRPRVLGVPDAFIDRYAPNGATPQDNSLSFTWAAPSEANPWQHLRDAKTVETPSDSAVPVILDQNTAMYALQLYGGVGQEFDVDFGAGRLVKFRIVGLLANSLLQGSLFIHEADLLKHFPETGGYRYFLIQSPHDKQDAVARQLERSLSDEGMAVHDAQRTLAELLSVQNTYLSSFQSLGGLGLLLGTLGLSAVQLRSVLRRQGELALLAALGFTRTRIRRMVLWESLCLLMLGLLAGTFAAVIAVTPHARLTGTAFPIATLSVLLSSVFVCGAVASWFATRSVLSLRLLDSLRAP